MATYFTLFFSAFTSATLLPGSSEALLAYLISETPSQIILLIAIASIGNILGSVFNWYCGAFLMHFQNRRWFPVTQTQIQKAQHWYGQIGYWSLLLAWLPVIGDPLTVLGGVLKIRLSIFILLVGIGKIIRYAVIAAATVSVF
ncbi:DedA family protein [Sneathiella sp. P13V-1]|uniref:YqaA family protein n=1 Tax=Sneathiella sp. P13V-1 TaxID=2697366 RepID=UPI00187B561F|nr:YqaA family protein [Sneathiella sp. P13V-1]MBE7635993.1 DedA family protein [Sneathiella sp. P13V-1]